MHTHSRIFSSLFFLGCMTATANSQECSPILAGLFDTRTTASAASFKSNYINWLNSNDIEGEQTLKNQSAAMGMSLPIDGVPVNFKNDFRDGKYHNKSLSKAFAQYLQSNTEQSNSFFESLKTANGTVVRAWQHCIDLKKDQRGLFCQITQAEDASELELVVWFKPVVDSGTTRLKLTAVQFDTEALEPKAGNDPVNVEINETGGGSFLFKRNREAGSRIEVRTDDSRYACTGPTAARYVTLVREPPRRWFREMVSPGDPMVRSVQRRHQHNQDQNRKVTLCFDATAEQRLIPSTFDTPETPQILNRNPTGPGWPNFSARPPVKLSGASEQRVCYEITVGSENPPPSDGAREVDFLLKMAMPTQRVQKQECIPPAISGCKKEE